MSEYSQGVCQDGVAILKDGQMMTIEEILEDLTNQEKLVEALALVVDQWTDGDGCFGSIEQARTLLAALEAEKGGEL